MNDDTVDDEMFTDDESFTDDEMFTDEELAELALAADPDQPLADDAVPFGADDRAMALLPDWYMPAPTLRRSRGRVVVLSVIAASLAVGNIVGFCVTSGFPEFVFG